MTPDWKLTRWVGGDPMRQAQISAALEAKNLRWEVMNGSRGRQVLRVDLEEHEGIPLPVVIKIHRRRRGGRRLRDLFERVLRRGPAAREWRALSRARAHDLPVPEPLAWAMGDEKSTALFMRACGDRPLLDAINATQSDERAKLARALGDLVHRIHAAGFVHGDLHLGNLRVTDASDGPVLSFVDLQKFRSARSERARLADWARLSFSLERATGDTNLVDAVLERSQRGADLHAARIAFLTDHQRGRARRRLTTGDHELAQLAKLRIDASHPGVPVRLEGLRDREIPAAVLEAAMNPDNLAAVGAPRRNGRVEIHRIVVGEHTLIRKHTRTQGLRRCVADAFRGSPAARAFRRGQRDRLISDRSAPALGFLERTRFGLPVESWLFLAEVGEHDLDQYVPRSPEEAESVALEVASWLGAQHLLGLGHRDAKAGNMRLTSDTSDTPGSTRMPRLWFVDLEDLTGPAAIPAAARRKALVQLNASLSDELYSGSIRTRALRQYVETISLEGPIDELIATITRESLARAHRWRGDDCSAQRIPEDA